MATYLYQAKDFSGKSISGNIKASSESEAQSFLRQKRLIPLKILEVKEGKSGKGSASLFQARVPSKELQIFTRQFSVLINAGIPVVDCLRMLSEGKRNKVLLEATKAVKLSIEGGRTLAESMAVHPQIFDRFFVNMVRAGEQAGILDNIFNRLSIYLEKAEKIRKQIKGAMAYPIIVLCVSILVVGGILFFVMPKMKAMYGTSQLPALTQMVLDFSDYVQAKWYVIIGGLVFVPWLFLQWYRTPDGKATCDRIFLYAPVIGDFIQKASIAKMTRTLATLLSSGVSLLEALDIAAKTAGNAVIEETLNRSKASVSSGKPLAAPLAREKAIPFMVTQMIAIGEESGAVDTMLNKVADFYEDDVENAVKAMTSMIEPIMMVGLGGIIAVLVVAMYLPIFNMGDVIGK